MRRALEAALLWGAVATDGGLARASTAAVPHNGKATAQAREEATTREVKLDGNREVKPASIEAHREALLLLRFRR